MVQFEVGQGQTLTLTLLTFNWHYPQQQQRVTDERLHCSMRATITDGLRVRTVPLCGLQESRLLIHESYQSRVSVYFGWRPPAQLTVDQHPSVNHRSSDGSSDYKPTAANIVFLLEITGQ